MPQNPPELMHYNTQFLSPGFIGQMNPAAFGGYGNPNLYYVGGHPQYSGSMGPPPMDQSWPIGWGNMAPPMRPPHPEPRHRGDDTMEIDEVYQPPWAPSRTLRGHQSRREGTTQTPTPAGPSRQPARDAGNWSPQPSRRKGKAKVSVRDTLEQEWEEQEGQLDELL
jgi:hypothetical protein